MTCRNQHRIFRVVQQLVLAGAMVFLASAAQAQTYNIIHNFAGRDGSGPSFGLTSDRAGNLYGTTELGGTHCGDSGCGTVFEMVRHGSNWILKQLYDFAGGTDGEFPLSGVIFGADGNLYGATNGGGQYGAGTIYKLQPPATVCKKAMCPWQETVLYSFTGLSDGRLPEGDLIFDLAGNLYGTTSVGGGGSCSGGCGVVFQLTPAHGSWTFSVVYTFTGLADGALPESGVILDHSGNLYGTTVAGGAHSNGTVFELTKAGAVWTKTVLHDFAGGSDGQFPQAGLVFDPVGNLFGFAEFGGSHNQGTAFELQPSSGGWNYSVLFDFGLQSQNPVYTPTLDSAGNLYGAANSGGAHAAGAIFKLTFSGGSWSYVSLHDFTGPDGEYPYGGVVFDPEGNLYGTASGGGANYRGVVWEITP